LHKVINPKLLNENLYLYYFQSSIRTKFFISAIIGSRKLRRVQHFVARGHVHAIFIHTLFIHNALVVFTRQKAKSEPKTMSWEVENAEGQTDQAFTYGRLSGLSIYHLTFRLSPKQTKNNCQFQVNCLFTLVMANREIVGAIIHARAIRYPRRTMEQMLGGLPICIEPTIEVMAKFS